MKLGIFAKTYERLTVAEVFAACAADELRAVQFNFVSAGLAPMPDQIPVEIVREVRQAAHAADVEIVSLSATFNMIHPDPAVRETGLRRLAVLASVAGELGATVLSLCTGSRDPENMWRRHPANDEPAAWDDLRASMTQAVAIAEEYDLFLGIEPEPGNVVRDAMRARQLLDEMETDRIGVVLDPANLIEGRPLDDVDAAIDEGISLLGRATILGHGKDRAADGSVRAPSSGIVPWDRFLRGLHDASFSGPLILHGFPADEAPAAASYLRRVLAEVGAA